MGIFIKRNTCSCPLLILLNKQDLPGAMAATELNKHPQLFPTQKFAPLKTVEELRMSEDDQTMCKFLFWCESSIKF